MTEQEWLECIDPTRMLKFLRGKINDRKLRLFVVACCRKIWHLLSDRPYNHGVDVAERYAGRLASAHDLSAAHAAAVQVAVNGSEGRCPGPLWCAAWFSDPFMGAWDNAGDPDTPAVLVNAATMKDAWIGAELCVPWAAALGIEQQAMAAVLRDVVHAPFRAIICRASWLRWNDCIAVSLAQAIYDERAFDRLPILADALEDAGCNNADILNHCRQPGEHVRGCWPVDLVLGKT